MGVLTWRDVAAPNFSGVQDGFQNFGNLITNALTAARAGLSKYDQAGVDRSNNALLADIAAAPTVDAAQAIAARVANDPHRGDYSAATLAALQSRPDSIIKQAANQSDLSFTNYNRTRTQTENAALDAAGPDAARLLSAYASGDNAGAEKILAASPALQKLTPSQFIDLASKGQDLTKGNLSITGTQTDQANSAQDRQIAQLGDAYGGVLRQSGLGPTDWNQNFPALQDTLTKKFGPVLGALIAERARKNVFGDPTAPVGTGGTDFGGAGGGGGSGVGGDPTRIMNYVAAQAGVPSVPDSIQTLGQYSDWAAGLNSKGIKSTAGGLFQIEGSTLRSYAPKVLGANWQSQPFDAQSQDKIGSAIYNDNNGSVDALRKQWPSLSVATASQLVSQKVPWEQARNIIAKGESGASNVEQIIAQATQDFGGAAGPALNKALNPDQVFAQQAVAALNDTADVRTVASRLVSAGGNGQAAGPLAGENVANVAGNIKAIADKYHISPAYAGLILGKSAGFNKNGPEKALDTFKGFFGGGDALNSQIDWKQVDQFAKLAGNPDALIRQAQAANAQDMSSSIVTQSAQQRDQALAVIRSKMAAARAAGRSYNPAADMIALGLAGDLHDQALTNSAAVTAAGRNTPPPPPTLDRHSVPQHDLSTAPATAPVQAKRAQAFLLQQFQNMIPSGAGPLQMPGIAAQFKQRFGISIDQVRSNPTAAWNAAKALDNRAAQLLSQASGNSNSFFRR